MEAAHTVYGQRFEQLQRLGHGSFGEVFTCLDFRDERFCALKVEPMSARHPQLSGEAEVLKALQGVPGVPALYWVGGEHSNYAIVMELLGRSFDQLLGECGGRFSMKTTCMVGEQMLQRLESLHACDYIHRDIKPENFAVGRHSAETVVHILDFGLAVRYCDPVTKQHIAPRENRGMTGTVRYASINAHMGLELSRRDDLESLFYLLIYFAKGALPWQGVTLSSMQDKCQRILEIKLNTPFDALTKGLPLEFAAGLRYIRSLKFDGKPNYAYVRKLLRDALGAMKEGSNPRYDWVVETELTTFPGRRREKPTPLLLRRRSSAVEADSKSRQSTSTQSGLAPVLNTVVREKMQQFHLSDHGSS